MGKSNKSEITLEEKIRRLKAAGIDESPSRNSEINEVAALSERIAAILNIIQSKPIKSTEMTYLIMYDINDDKVRNQVSKYLIKKSCIRIQKSVFLARTEHVEFQEIHNSLNEINGYYENKDSIILVPVNSSDVRSMKLIGQNVDIQIVTSKPSTLFF